MPSRTAAPNVISPARDPGGHRGVDVLEVHVHDALGVGRGDRDRVAAPDQRGGRCRRTGRRGSPASTRSVSSPVSTMVPTWGCSAATTPRVRAWSAIRSRLPSRVAQPASSSSGRASYPSTPVYGRQHDDAGAAGDTAVDEAVHLGHRVVRGVVQQDGEEAADGAQPVRRELLGLGGRRDLEEAVGTELGGGQPQLAHLLEHRAGLELVAPAGHLAHAPRDRGAGDPGRARAGGRRGSGHGARRVLRHG